MHLLILIPSVLTGFLLFFISFSPNSQPNFQKKVDALLPVKPATQVLAATQSAFASSPSAMPKSTKTPKSSNKKTKPSPTATISPKPISTASPTNSLTSNPTSLPTSQPTTSSWFIRSISSMKITKDMVCNQPSDTYIQNWINKAAELGVNYIAVETPYDNPACADALSFTKKWVGKIRAKGLLVWHRHMPLAFEGIYSVSKNNSSDYLDVISNYVKNNSSLFKSGDIFTPIPEPQNGGINGITHCAGGVCQFESAADFNKWLRDAITKSKDAFAAAKIGGIKIGYYGFDGFVAWGHNNPDWNGILEPATVSAMGNITIDHYPELVGTSMEADLKELEVRYPGVPIIIGEWGTVTSGNLVEQVKKSMGAAKRSSVVGFNYWHMGMGGNESLINDDFSLREHYSTVQSFFRGTL